ncbi:MAG: putative rane associated protein [Candidatus Angelobacter sp.]|nr:putative rane associated protein [Candidatus Angelobacter sp.]
MHVKVLEEELSSTLNSLVCGFHQLLDLKDLNTGVHSTRLAEWGMRVGQELGIPEESLHDIEMAAVVHDIGKIGVPDAILNKNGPLTEDERALMNKHPEYGWGVLRLFPALSQTSLITLHHHESFDGNGYPGKLRGSEIPLGARIVTVIDSFDAMVSNRPYRKGLPTEEAKRRLVQSSGTQFDPAVVKCFLGIVDSELPAVFAAVSANSNLIF